MRDPLSGQNSAVDIAEGGYPVHCPRFPKVRTPWEITVLGI